MLGRPAQHSGGASSMGSAVSWYEEIGPSAGRDWRVHMSNVKNERSQKSSATGEGEERGQGVAQQAIGQKTEQVQERVQGVAQQAMGQTREQLRDQISARSSQAGAQVSSAATALRRTGEQLRNEGQGSVANAIEAAAERSERLGSYLTHSDGEQMLRDVEDLARRQPWLFAAGSAAVGSLASRFMKASSSGRYEAQFGSSPYPQSGNGSAGYITPGNSYYDGTAPTTGGGTRGLG